MAVLFYNLWWIIPLILTICFYYLIYRSLVRIGRLSIISTLILTIPLRLISGLFKGFVTSIVFIFYGFLTLLFIFFPFYWYSKNEIFKDIIVYGTVLLFLMPYFYFIFKVFKEELDHYKSMQDS